MGVKGHLMTNGSRHGHSRKIRRTFNNIKITILCGIVTILVLRGTVGISTLLGLPSPSQQTNPVMLEDIDRILREIRSDSDPDSDPTVEYNSSLSISTDRVKTNYTLGLKVTNWDQHRRNWLSFNPGFSPDPNKPRILLITGSTPNPCEQPIGDHYLLKALKNKIDYTRLHGIEIAYNMAHLDQEMSGYWTKLPLIRRLMLAHPEVEWIWWMDSDAIITDMAFEIPITRYDDHNLIIHGYHDLLFKQNSWIALNTGSFLLRNCQWSLDLLDAWAPMGPRGAPRNEAGKILTANLEGRPDFEADDQSALIYLLLSQKEKWIDKVYIESSYYLHGFWRGLVDKYEEMMEKYHPGLGDERWPFVTHFVGCKLCSSYADYSAERCISSMERAFNFADNQVLQLYGFAHKGLGSPKVKKIRKDTANPLEVKENLNLEASLSF
jgi:xyloglucan 6-xylosyltransferase